MSAPVLSFLNPEKVPIKVNSFLASIFDGILQCTYSVPFWSEEMCNNRVLTFSLDYTFTKAYDAYKSDEMHLW